LSEKGGYTSGRFRRDFLDKGMSIYRGTFKTGQQDYTYRGGCFTFEEVFA